MTVAGLEYSKRLQAKIGDPSLAIVHLYQISSMHLHPFWASKQSTKERPYIPHWLCSKHLNGRSHICFHQGKLLESDWPEWTGSEIMS